MPCGSSAARRPTRSPWQARSRGSSPGRLRPGRLAAQSRRDNASRPRRVRPVAGRCRDAAPRRRCGAGRPRDAWRTREASGWRRRARAPGWAPCRPHDRTIVAPDRAGVAFFLRGARRVGALVVNAEPEESDLTRLDPAALVVAHSRPRGRVPGQHALECIAVSSSPRRSLLVPVLVLALAVLLLESAVAGAGQRRTT